MPATAQDCDNFDEIGRQVVHNRIIELMQQGPAKLAAKAGIAFRISLDALDGFFKASPKLLAQSWSLLLEPHHCVLDVQDGPGVDQQRSAHRRL
jgi:hypothetical protein